MKLPNLHLSSLRGLITVPGSIALAIWFLVVPLLWIDREWQDEIIRLTDGVLAVPYDTAEVVLSTVAAAAITTLSLVYSLVLVVFTLAAGTIAPRLLRRFTGDRVNQVTAGLLGGTFLLSLTILHQANADFVPVISVAVAVLLSAIFVLQLIFFVHSVSLSVTIDAEIASISTELEWRLDEIVINEEERQSDRRETQGPRRTIVSKESGYVGHVDEEALFELACRERLTLHLLRKPGRFVLEGQALVAVVGGSAATDFELLAEDLRQCIPLTQSRDGTRDIEYLISLLLEIALRALSPGVNDTFTAVASVDRLSAALVGPVRRGLRERDLTDSEGIVRAAIPGLGIADMLNTALHPLRNAAAGNLLMIQSLADALSRLHDIGNREARAVIETHGRLLLATCQQSDPLAEDYAFIERRLTFLGSH